MLYKPPTLIGRVSAVICNGTVVLVFVKVTTLVTATRGVGMVKVRVRTPKTVVSVPFVAEVKASVPPFTVNVTVLLVPPGVVTLTVLAVWAAVAEIVKFAVTVVAFTTVMALTVIPAPDTFTAVVPVRFVPVKVTETVMPRWPVLGAIEVKVGAATVTANSTAPASTALFVFLKLLKKSVVGAAV
jgi:hypothetical protein